MSHRKTKLINVAFPNDRKGHPWFHLPMDKAQWNKLPGSAWNVREINPGPIERNKHESLLNLGFHGDTPKNVMQIRVYP